MVQTIRNVFANKSTATLKVRSGSLAMFGRWLASKRAKDSVSIFPLFEKDVYDYLCELWKDKALRSRAPSFLGPLRDISLQ